MIIVASKPGELGNRLFVFANFIAAAREHQLKFTNPAFDEYAKYFPATKHDLFGRYPARRSILKPGPALRKRLYQLAYYAGRLVAKSGIKAKSLRTIVLDWRDVCDLSSPEFLATLGPRQLVFMQGWKFLSDAALVKHAAAIREFFRPLEQHRANVAALIERARADTDILVGVHIRHGIINFANARHFWNPPEKYAELMREVEAFFPGQRVTFLICSDVKQDPEVFADFRIVLGTGHLIEDLYAFAECDYLFGPPSTFTMWASFYGEVPLKVLMDSSKGLALDDFLVFGAKQEELKQFDIHYLAAQQNAEIGSKTQGSTA